MNYNAKHPDIERPNKPQLISYQNIRKMYEENLSDARVCEQITRNAQIEENYRENASRLGNSQGAAFRRAFFEDVLRDKMISGFTMDYLHGKIIKQGERGNYYRGEKRIYPESATSLSRPLAKLSSTKDRMLYRLVADMRIAEFDYFLRKFDRIKCWEEDGLTVLTEPLAQHYGLETDWLDITNDFNVALFFACCYWDCKEEKWYPLTKKQTEENDQTRYGVIFRASARSVELANMTNDLSVSDEGKIVPIGYQPFMRCHTQYGYGIHMREPIPLQNSTVFEELRFRHTEQLSRDIYELMDCGRKIYPKEGFDDFQDVVKAIANATVFSETAFLSALQKNNLSSQADYYKLELENSRICKLPIHIHGEEHPFKVSRQRMRRANRKDEGFSIEKEYGIKLMTRYVYYPPSNKSES